MGRKCQAQSRSTSGETENPTGSLTPKTPDRTALSQASRPGEASHRPVTYLDKKRGLNKYPMEFILFIYHGMLTVVSALRSTVD